MGNRAGTRVVGGADGGGVVFGKVGIMVGPTHRVEINIARLDTGLDHVVHSFVGGSTVGHTIRSRRRDEHTLGTAVPACAAYAMEKSAEIDSTSARIRQVRA